MTKKGAQMASVTLPDGKQLEIEPGEKARDVAEKIGKRLARDAVVAKLDGELIDLETPPFSGVSRLSRGSPQRVSRSCATRRRTRWRRQSRSSTPEAS